LTGTFDFTADFISDGAALPDTLRAMKPHLAPTGQLWIAWPKTSVGGSSPRRKEIIRVGDDHALVESLRGRGNESGLFSVRAPPHSILMG